jgi:hypothetical protein
MAARNRTDGFVDPCIPTLAAKPPSGPDWVHEIKHDGYRLIVRRDGKAVRLFTRRGHDWTDRYPAIASAAAKLRAKSFTLDGEAVVTARTGSLCSMRSTGGTRPRTRCYTHSTSWSSTARICGRCRSATARRSWRRGVPARLQARARAHRVEAARCTLPVGTLAGLDQGEESGQPGNAAGADVAASALNHVRGESSKLAKSTSRRTHRP